MQLTFEDKYAVLGSKNTSYDGIFYTAVKSTMIFCRPSCRARKPLAKNVEFYDTTQGPLRDGYRPCKICRPMEPAGTTPKYIRDLIAKIHKEPFQKIRDQDLREMDIAPTTLRRWFKTHHGMTFQAYQRMIRINLGYQQIQKGDTVTTAALDAGFESLSGFNEASMEGLSKKLFGEAPTKLEDVNVVHLDRIATPLGAMFVGASDKGLCLLEFSDRRSLETELLDIRKRFSAVIVPGANTYIEQAKEELDAYFKGALRTFQVPLDTAGTEFQKRVWDVLTKIPYGETWSYLDQAKALGNPKAVRAVASANGKNKISIIIPCHRVIGSDGSLTGYGGGLPRKKWLLDLESGSKTP